MAFFIPWRVVAEESGTVNLDLLGPPGRAGGAVADFILVIFRFGATMELGRVHHIRCPHARARDERRFQRAVTQTDLREPFGRCGGY